MECDYTTYFHEKSPIRAKPEPEQPTITNVVFETDKQLMKLSDRFSALQKLAKERGIQYSETNETKTTGNTGIDNVFHKRKQNLLIRLGERVKSSLKHVCINKIGKSYRRENSKNRKYKKFLYKRQKRVQISKRQLDCELDLYMARVGDTNACDQRAIKEETNVSNSSQSVSTLNDTVDVKNLFGGFGGPNWRKKIIINNC